MPMLLPAAEGIAKTVPIQSPANDSVKILGLVWKSIIDSFSYSVKQPSSEPTTKRGMLSYIARIFDPLGFLSPVVFKAKSLIQDVWKANIGWDDLLPEELDKAWHELTTDWHTLSSITIPRFMSHGKSKIRIMGFCDASLKGYAAAIYLRSESDAGNINVSLIKAKSKVAPLKFHSIPRLELCGALILSRLVSSIPDISAEETFCFTDSQVVLASLNSPIHELQVFEANCVSQILKIVPVTRCGHVSSDDNPADVASRGCNPSRLAVETLWWSGPQWLKDPICNRWQPNSVSVAMTSVSAKQEDHVPYDWTSRFSSFHTLIRTVARIVRLAQRIKSGNQASRQESLTSCTDPTTKEFAEAELRCIHFVQRLHFPSGVFKGTQNTPKELSQLSPFLDERGILKVGGRLQSSPLEYSARHPILLPRKSHFARLVISQIHMQHYHSGPSLTLALLRGKYWISRAAKLIRSQIQGCVQCRIQRAKPLIPLMAPLPIGRFDQSRPFIQVGVDYAGPFLIKESRRRNASLGKAYLCQFVCMASKALHLELVSSLTTRAFIAALERFISRRGQPSTIWSDHGTNFIGASNFLKEVFKLQRSIQNDVSNHLIAHGVEWRFIPPRAPHFGGLWEAGVKSVKGLLSNSIGKQPFAFEELTTALAKVEAILNSRPLCPLTEDANDFNFLTPGHFLIGTSLTSLLRASDHPEVSSILKKWEAVQAHPAYVWDRWRRDDLHTLQQSRKWTKQVRNPSIGDLVIL